MSYFMQRNGVDDIRDPTHRANAARALQSGEIGPRRTCKIGSQWGSFLGDSLFWFNRPTQPHLDYEHS